MLSILILMLSVSMADEKIPVKEGFKTMDMQQFKELEKTPKSKSGVVFSTGCKSKTGVDYKSSDSGYEACLHEAELDKSIQKNGASPTTNIQFGN